MCHTQLDYRIFYLTPIVQIFLDYLTKSRYFKRFNLGFISNLKLAYKYSCLEKSQSLGLNKAVSILLLI